MAYEKRQQLQNITDIRIQNDKTKDYLRRYLLRVSAYENFDQEQEVLVFADAGRDFIGFESIRYRLSFISNDHRISTIMSTPYEPVKCRFCDLAKIV